MGGLIVLSVVASVLEAFGISMVLPVFSGLLSGDSFNDGRIQNLLERSGLETLDTFSILVLITAVFFIKGGFSFAIGLLIPRLAIKIEEDIRRTLMSRILDAKWEIFHQAEIGRFVNVLNKESQAIVTATKYFCRFITDLAEAVILVVISLFLSPLLVGSGIFLLAQEFLLSLINS